MKIKKVIVAGMILVGSVSLSGCFAPSSSSTAAHGGSHVSSHRPSTDYEWSAQNAGLNQHIQITEVTAKIDESKLPSDMTLEAQAMEDVTSGKTPESSVNDHVANYANADRTCFLGIGTYGKVLAPGGKESLTDALVDAQTGYIDDVDVNVATIRGGDQKPLEVKVARGHIGDNIIFMALRAFDMKVPADTLTEDGKPAIGNQVLSVSYSCASNPPITIKDFQNVLNAVTLSYTIDGTGK